MVGYGHSSVAEHAVLSIAVENVSILGAKILEENRLSSFTEKSTRYQVMDGSNYYTPPAFSEGRLGRLYRDSAAALFSVYGEVIPAGEGVQRAGRRRARTRRRVRRDPGRQSL